MKERVNNKLVVGWREYVSLPEWGVRRIRAKIDTGARISAIHVAEIEELSNGWIRFEVVTREGPSRRTVWVEAAPVREARVRPSSGRTQARPVVHANLQLGGVEQHVELSLVCRKGMLCRMLVGRLALGDRFIVDPGRKYVLGNTPKFKSSKEDRA